MRAVTEPLLILTMNDSALTDLSGENATLATCAVRFDMSPGRAEPIVVIVTSAFILAGNAIILVTLGTTKSVSNPHSYLLSALAVGGFVMGCIAALAIYPALAHCWPYGDTVCQLSAYTLNACSTFNLLILVLLSLERYAATVYPIWYRIFVTKVKMGSAITCCGSLSVLLLVVMFILQSDYEYSFQAYICKTTLSSFETYRWILSCVLLIPSFVIITYTSAVMLLTALRRSRQRQRLFGTSPTAADTQPRSNTRQTSTFSQQNSRLLKVSVLILLTFYVSWVPSTVRTILEQINVDDSDVSTNAPKFEFIASWLFISNTVFNILIYFFMIKLFRARVKELCAKLCCCACKAFRRSRSKDDGLTTYPRPQAIPISVI
ncbi:trace amine-associated receptor 8b-like [Acanthaster planci]|uniref:Trace amine-associated receptor 8b-like n=1 Tax=Acanthaster planci TaxID=133434 RepID=A0A8B7ZMA3_ACAPL|nr:trace amine-associated receptor 8b-like [Acanthaster planci]